MSDFKLKIVVTVLTGIIFSFVFIILAFVLPPQKEVTIIKKPSNILEEVSKSLRKK